MRDPITTLPPAAPAIVPTGAAPRAFARSLLAPLVLGLLVTDGC